MGLFGGGNSTSVSKTTNVDKRLVADGGSVGVSSDTSTVNVSVLDEGAVLAAIDLSKNANQITLSSIDKVLGLLNKTMDSNTKTADMATTAVEAAYDNAKGAGTEVKALLIIAGLAAAIAIWKGR